MPYDEAIDSFQNFYLPTTSGAFFYNYSAAGQEFMKWIT